MRPIRYAEEVGRGILLGKQSLETVEGLWNEWEIHCLILASFGLQVFLFFAAGMRRHSVSRILNSLIWLAYLSADSVAIFVLGHLAVHASGSHQLLIFWAPFLLLHLGGQDTITAFSMQDNELWTRHLLALVTQSMVAGYIISISSWQDRRLLAATVLMLLSGFFKYVGRTFCLFVSRTKFWRSTLVSSLDRYVRGVHSSTAIYGCGSSEELLERRVHDMMLDEVDARLPTAINEYTPLLVDTPLNGWATIEGADIIPYLLNKLKVSPDRSRVYGAVGALLVRSYEGLYTKARLHSAWVYGFKITKLGDPEGSIVGLQILSFFLIFPLVSALITLGLFMVAEKGQLYNQTDVTISYILLIGAIILELASLFMSMISYFGSSDAPTSPLTPVASRVANYIHPAGRHRKHWSKLLAQYNMIQVYTPENSTGIVSIVPKCIGKLLNDGEGFTRVPITKGLEEFVLDKLLYFGTRDQRHWNFASFRGQLALQRWPAMHTIIDSADLPTSVLIWHIATEICYSEENSSTHQTEIIRVSRELSNYILYLVFKCGVMSSSSSKLVHINTHREMERTLQRVRHVDLGMREAIRMVFEANIHVQQPANRDNLSVDVESPDSSQPLTQVQLLKNNIKALDSPVLPRAFTVAAMLNGMPGGDRWAKKILYDPLASDPAVDHAGCR